MGCDTFGPKHIWSADIWSPTIGPQLIGPSGQTVPNQFSPHGQMVPKNSVSMDKWSQTNLVPLDKWSLEYSICPGGQAVGIRKYGDLIGWGTICQRGPNFGDRLSRGTGSPGTELVGDRLSMGTEFLGTVCPLGPNLLGTGSPGGPIFRGPEVQGDRKWGTGSPGIKWARDQMGRSPQR